MKKQAVVKSAKEVDAKKAAVSSMLVKKYSVKYNTDVIVFSPFALLFGKKRTS